MLEFRSIGATTQASRQLGDGVNSILSAAPLALWVLYRAAPPHAATLMPEKA
jgi:hypothetical protein